MIVSDTDIARLMVEGKPLPADLARKLALRTKRGHRERELGIQGKNGNGFRLVLRQSTHNPLDFSVIVLWLPPHSYPAFRLRRYNGKSHEHSNVLESEKLYDFHIHKATERYQRAGFEPDAFAEATARYNDLRGALSCALHDCGFSMPFQDTADLFDATEVI